MARHRAVESHQQLGNLLQVLENDRATGRAVVAEHGVTEQLPLAREITRQAVRHLWYSLNNGEPRPQLESLELPELPNPAPEVAEAFGKAASSLETERAFYEVGLLYTALLPREFRSTHGVYYTPPALTDCLLARAENAGVDWRTARVLDPACGGGAFLAPVVRRMLADLPDGDPGFLLGNVAARVHGIEVDPFAAWLSQVAVDALLTPLRTADQELPQVVEVRDTLWSEPMADTFDLVVGNPPYGRQKLSREARARYTRSLYGHANLYGLFTDAALDLTRPGGVIAFVTPTSFLAGGYFRNLRALLAQNAPPVTLDFVDGREGVFADVLQETLLATYRKGPNPKACEVSTLEVASPEQAIRHPAGEVHLPAKPSGPWPIPRTPEQAGLVAAMEGQPCNLADWGYAVSTGPLVWNRKKEQLAKEPGPGRYPLIWAEAVTPAGEFSFRASQRNHQPYFQIRGGDDWLLIDQPCVLLQRTTSKEQNRRLLAAAIPQTFIDKHGAVVVENHLNVLRPSYREPAVDPGTLTAFLNSGVADRIFRCLNGSVAVSAYELEALPLPTPKDLVEVRRLVAEDAPHGEIDAACEAAFFNGGRG